MLVNHESWYFTMQKTKKNKPEWFNFTTLIVGMAVVLGLITLSINTMAVITDLFSGKY